MNWGTRFAVGFMLTTVGLIGFNHAYSMGLGEARVDSFLNQPLDVQVRLIEVSEADLDSLTVRIGDASAYDQLGLMTDVLALGLSVSIDRSQRPAMLQITSQRPATDPVVQLLVDARWSSGRILREYTLFLDPATITASPPPVNVQQRTQAPVIAEAATAAQPAVAEPAVTESGAEPVTEEVTEPVTEEVTEPVTEEVTEPATNAVTEPVAEPVTQATPVAVRSDSSSYSVMPGDTLWSVASGVLPDNQLSMDQTMLAIVDLNPSAFRNGSIHQLLSGAELQLPDQSQIASIDRQFARQTVEIQNRAFNQDRDGPIAVVADAAPVRLETEESAAVETPVNEAPVPAAESAEESTAANSDEFRLELVPPAEGDEGLGLNAEQREASRLSQQLARTEEELFTAQLEAEDFQTRLTELETMINDNPGGRGIQDFDLAQLEQTLREAREASAADPLDSAISEDLSQQVDTFLEQFAEVPNDDQTAEIGAAEASQQPAEPAATSAPVVTQVGEPRPGLFSNPIVLGIGLLVLLIVGLLLWFFIKHIREPEHDQPLERSQPQPAAPAPNPLEAAESLVQAQPDNLNAHLALLKALDGTEYTSRFSDALDSMYARVDDDEEPVWQEALALAGNAVPDHALVQGSLDWAANGDSSNDAIAGDKEADVEDLMALMDDTAEPDNKLEQDLDAPLLHDDDGDPSWQAGEIDDSPDLGVPFEADPAKTEPAADEANQFIANQIDEPEAVDAKDEPLSYDWPEASEGDELAEQDEDDSADQTEDFDSGDIFGATDDDIDVKLDLARAYLSWNSIDSAKTLLEEVLSEGNQRHQEQAKKLLDGL